MRPKVICHIMGSVDGRLMNERWTPPCDGRPQSDLLAVYAEIGKELGTSAWMFGLNTARAFFPDIYRPADGIPAHTPETFCAPGISERRFVVSDPDGTIRYDKNTVRGDGIIALLGRRVSEDYLRHLCSVGISYTFAGDDGYDLCEALECLHDRFGITSLSLQGGGIINGAFLKAGLIDELSLVVYPGIDGLAGVSSIFECPGMPDEHPAAGQSLELVSVRQMPYGVVWLRYRILKSI